MKKFSGGMRGLLVLALISLVGCEWSGSNNGNGTAWNSSVAWVNFNGVYRAASGLLVTAYTDTTVNTNTPINVIGESIKVTDGVSTNFVGKLVHHPVVAGSLVVHIGPADMYDQGDGTILGSGWTGTINYGTGGWTIDTAPFVIGPGLVMYADYQYTLSSGAGQPGSTKYPINLFTVQQMGNRVQFTDNNGAVYSGQISEVDRSGGTTNAANIIVGEEVTALFQASGVSKAGVQVTMTGAFSGTVSGGTAAAATSTTFYLEDRRLRGSWVESKGQIGEISGQASPAPISGP